MVKLILFGTLTFGAIALSWVKRRQAKAYLRKVNSGQCCLSCDSTEVTREPGGVRCLACGYLTTNELLGTGVSDAELKALNDVERMQRW